MKLFFLFIFAIIALPSFCMLRPTLLARAMHRPRNPRPASIRKQIVIHRTAQGLIETLRIRVCNEKSNLALPGSLSDNNDEPQKHIRIKRKSNTISQRREIYINGKEFCS